MGLAFVRMGVRLGVRAGVPAALLACALLAGCDSTPPGPAAPPQACNCQPAPSVLPPAPTPAPEPVRETEHRHHYRHYRMTYSDESESESAITEYGYSSDSHLASYEREHRTHYEGAGTATGYTGGALWIDGYGRAYHADHAARRAGTMTHGRLKPWAHYDEDCDR